MNRRWMIAGLTAALAGLLTAACGGGANWNKASLRLVNGSSAYASLDLVVDGDRLQSGVAYGQRETYALVDAGGPAVDLTLPGATAALSTTKPALTERRSYTLLAYGGEGALKSVLIDDDVAAESGKGRLRVINAAPEAGALDVYLTGPADPLSTATALQATAELGQLGALVTVDAAGWRLRVTGAGDKDDIRFDQSGLSVGAGQVITIALTPTTGGPLVNALWLVQRGGVQSLANTQARVRLAAPQRGQVSVSVGGQALAAEATAPLVGAYQLVPSGPQTVSAAWNGTALALSEVTLAPGTDQTLLLHGVGGTPGAVWLLDDNRPPTVEGRAKVRLVHGLDGLPGPLSLTVNLLPVLSGLSPPGASAYANVDGGTQLLLTVTATGDGSTVFETASQALVAGRVYSVFVVDGLVVRGIVRRDR